MNGIVVRLADQYTLEIRVVEAHPEVLGDPRGNATVSRPGGTHRLNGLEALPPALLSNDFPVVGHLLDSANVPARVVTRLTAMPLDAPDTPGSPVAIHLGGSAVGRHIPADVQQVKVDAAVTKVLGDVQSASG